MSTFWRNTRRLTLFFGLLRLALSAEAAPPVQFAEAHPVLFNKAFESASIGDIERVGEGEYRLHVIGQQDSRGRNRQATWFYFRMDDVAGGELTLHFTDFKGEYNDAPAKSPANAAYRPWFSEDNVHWQPFAETAWDEAKDEVVVRVRPKGDSIWLAHVPPYPEARLQRLLEEAARSPHARVEVIGKSALGRELSVLTVTNAAVPEARKKVVWLQARQHPWEAGTSYTIEGAIRFVVSDEPAAARLRDENVFKFMPMMNPDGVARGDVRFNVHGYDTNRQWDRVDLRDKQWLQKMPEIWYVKDAILAQQARQPIAIMVNLHNTETNEYGETLATTEPEQGRLQRLFGLLRDKTRFDPTRPALTMGGAASANSTLSLWTEARVPVMLIEQRITTSPKLGRIATPEDHVAFGRELIAVMAEAAKGDL